MKQAQWVADRFKKEPQPQEDKQPEVTPAEVENDEKTEVNHG